MPPGSIRGESPPKLWPVVDVAMEITGISRAERERLLDPARLTSGEFRKGDLAD